MRISEFFEALFSPRLAHATPEDVEAFGEAAWLVALRPGHVVVCQSSAPEELPHVVRLQKERRLGVGWIGSAVCGTRRALSWRPVLPVEAAEITICGACARHLRECDECRELLAESKAIHQRKPPRNTRAAQ